MKAKAKAKPVFDINKRIYINNSINKFQNNINEVKAVLTLFSTLYYKNGKAILSFGNAINNRPVDSRERLPSRLRKLIGVLEHEPIKSDLIKNAGNEDYKLSNRGRQVIMPLVNYLMTNYKEIPEIVLKSISKVDLKVLKTKTETAVPISKAPTKAKAPAKRKPIAKAKTKPKTPAKPTPKAKPRPKTPPKAKPKPRPKTPAKAPQKPKAPAKSVFNSDDFVRKYAGKNLFSAYTPNDNFIKKMMERSAPEQRLILNSLEILSAKSNIKNSKLELSKLKNQAAGLEKTIIAKDKIYQTAKAKEKNNKSAKSYYRQYEAALKDLKSSKNYLKSVLQSIYKLELSINSDTNIIKNV